MKTLFNGLAVLGLMLIAFSAQAQQDYAFEITNDTGYTILFLNVSPADAQTWEEDVLDEKVILDGETVTVNLSGYNSPVFDIRAIDEDLDSYTFFGVNVAEGDLTITLADLDIE